MIDTKLIGIERENLRYNVSRAPNMSDYWAKNNVARRVMMFTMFSARAALLKNGISLQRYCERQCHDMT